MDPVKYSMRYGHCMNCGWEGPETEMSALWPNIPDLNNRVEPGEEVPLGECPECESLCRLMNEVGVATDRRELDEALSNAPGGEE